MSIHDGHRKRMKERFRQEGLDHFEEHEVLELLLYYCIPVKDTNPLAHELLNRFGSLSQVLEAPAEELEKVPGVGEHVSTLLNLTTALGRYYLVNRAMTGKVAATTEQCGEYLLPFFFGRSTETVYLLCLDAKCKILCCREVSEGSVNAAGVSIRKIVEVALTANATSVVLAHNHPSGIAVPSAEDIQTTMQAAKALSMVDVILADHIIVADGDYVSLVQSGYYHS